MALNGVDDAVPNNEEQRAAETEQMFATADRVMRGMQTPQAIRDLPCFDGDAVKLHSFIKSVENLIPFIETLEGTPFYAIWTQAIRTKITGEADKILEIYGTPANWNDIKNNLIAYYNDKRDPVTLTRELFQLQQTGSIEDLYGKVQNLLSLLINHTNINTEEINLKNDRINTHQENALQVFLAGLREPIGGNVRARQPKTLKEGFDAAIQERNFLSRAGLNIQKSSGYQTSSYPPKPFANSNQSKNSGFSVNPFAIPKLPVPNKNVFAPKPYPTPQPKQVPMEVDRSIRSKQANYINRPNSNNPRPPYPPPYPPPYALPYPPPYPYPNNRNHFQPSGPPKVQIEELHNTENPEEQQIYDPYFYYYYYHFYAQPQEYCDQNQNSDENIEKPEQLSIEAPPQKTQNENSDQIDNLNFQMALFQSSPT